jgi:hypothetical protein
MEFAIRPQERFTSVGVSRCRRCGFAESDKLPGNNLGLNLHSCKRDSMKKIVSHSIDLLDADRKVVAHG